MNGGMVSIAFGSTHFPRLQTRPEGHSLEELHVMMVPAAMFPKDVQAMVESQAANATGRIRARIAPP
jgi:hypothetical protein